MKKNVQGFLVLALMLLSAGAAAVWTPTVLLADLRPEVQFSEVIPATFGPWHELPHSSVQIIDPSLQQSLNALYSQTLTRTYVHAQGYRIMLSMAYGKTQRADLQLHHPEVCYPAQGFAISSNQVGTMSTPFGALPVRRLETQLGRERAEPVTYWALVGDTVVLNSVARKKVAMRYGMQGQIADGLLFRVSSIDKDSNNAFAQQALFTRDLLQVLTVEQRHRVAGI